MKRSLLLLFILSFLFPSLLSAGVVKGTVRDTSGQPVPFAAIIVKNSSYGVNTSINGSYFLELKPGNYTLVYSQIGFEKQEKHISITESSVSTINITLREIVSTLGTAEIVATGDRDKGKEIMKKVIASRDEYFDRVSNYKCHTYQKSSLEKIRIEKPGDSLVAKAEPKPEPKPEPIDTTTKKGKRKKEKDEKSIEEVFKQKQLNLIESISETYYKKPGTYKENILGYHDFAAKKPGVGNGTSGNFEYGEHDIAPQQYSETNPYLLISDAPGSDFNFYKNQISVPTVSPRPLLSPAASTALINYRFEFLGSFRENGKTIHQISVIPIFDDDALFFGSIFVQDSTWAIVSVNLRINPTVLNYSKDFSVIIDYSEVAPLVFLPVRREFNYTIREGKFDIIGNMRADHSDYNVNITIPPKTFNDEVKHYADDAFDKDSSYWVSERTIELEEKEIKYIHQVDSLVDYYASDKYLHSIDSAYNHINIWSFLINGVGHRNRVRGNEWFIDPLTMQVNPFGVGGYRHRFGGHYNRDLKNGMLIETDGQIDYGFLNKDVRGKLGVGLTYMPLRFVRTFVRVGDYYDMVNNFASLQSLFSRSNYVRTQTFSVAQRMEIVNGLFGELTLDYSDQFPITGMRIEQWSNQLFGELNTPSDFVRYVKTEIKLELKYRFRQKYVIKNHRKLIVGTKYPEIRLLYRKGIPGLLNSEVDFDYIEFGSADEIKLGRFGTSAWNVQGGGWLNNRNLRLLENKFFRGSDSFLFSDPLRSFQLLGPTLSTDMSFLRINFIHHFEGAFGTKIPLYSKLKITSAVGGGTLMIPDKNFYHQEFYAGFERVIRIKQQLFRLGVFAVTADNNISKASLTWKIGISYYDPMMRRWSY